jgi:hypothetical protein
VLNHIYKYDDPNNLLIFYYTGHGDQRENALELSACVITLASLDETELTLARNQNFMGVSGSHLPTALWSSAEEPILKEMVGDALSILDCCMASMAGIKCRSGLPRTYQLLAAAAADAPTCGPGQNSFTTALCDSLEELSNGPEEGNFLLSQLCQRINTKRKSQACIPWDQTGHFKRTIQLHRLEVSAGIEDSFCNEDPEQSALHLRLSFRKSDLEDRQIESLAEKLPHACHEANVPLRRIDWVRMTKAEPGLVRTPSTYRTTPFGADEQSLQRAQADAFFEVDDNEIFGSLSNDFYRASRAVSVAQRFRTAVRRKQATKHRRNMFIFMVLKLFALMFIFVLLYYRGEQGGLVLSGFLLVYRITFGPCRFVDIGEFTGERGQCIHRPLSNGRGELGISKSRTA